MRDGLLKPIVIYSYNFITRFKWQNAENINEVWIPTDKSDPIEIFEVWIETRNFFSHTRQQLSVEPCWSDLTLIFVLNLLLSAAYVNRYQIKKNTSFEKIRGRICG